MKKIEDQIRTMSYFVFAILSFLLIVSCSQDEENQVNNEETANLAVRLTDAPGDYEAVFVDVEDVMIKAETGESGVEWVSVGNINAGVYDLLELTGGVDVLLADSEVPAGPLSQIRLVLGTENSIVIDGEVFPLETPSAQQSGLKMNVNQTLEAGEDYYFLMDFDVEESIVTTGAGGYILKPVIRLSTEAEIGMISGTVEPAGFQYLVTAENESTSVSAYTDAEGNFVLHGLPDGTYDVTITPEIASGFDVMVQEGVEVSNAATVDIGTILFE